MNEPRPYDLMQQSEVDRWFREMMGYFRISRHHGTDREGREYAYQALRTMAAHGTKVTVTLDPKRFDDPPVGAVLSDN